MMWDIVRAVLISYGIIVVFEYAIKAMFASRQSIPTAAISSEQAYRMLAQQISNQYEDGPTDAIGRGLPKRKAIGF